MSVVKLNNLCRKCHEISKQFTKGSLKMRASVAEKSIITSFNNKKIRFATRPNLGTLNIFERFYGSTEQDSYLVDSNTYERVCEETLDSLAEYFEELVASEPKLEKADIMYGAGVLTVDLGKYGTYVINRQSPNRQIWLSSPTSGPKRYDYSIEEDCWVYKHDGKTLHSLLKSEISDIIGRELSISNCSHCKL